MVCYEYWDLRLCFRLPLTGFQRRRQHGLQPDTSDRLVYRGRKAIFCKIGRDTDYQIKCLCSANQASAVPQDFAVRQVLLYIMPAEQFKSTLTRACRCKLLNCSGARFLRNFAKKPCTLKRITFWFFLKSGDNQWILTVKTKVLTHKIEILTRFYIIAFANAIIQ